MTSALPVLLALTGAACLARWLVPEWRSHGAAAEAWHVAMLAAMLAMLVLPVRRDAALLQILLFVVGLSWCVAHLVAGRVRAVHLRLGAGFVAMLVMLSPVAFASATAAVPGMPGMPGMHEGNAGVPLWVQAPLLAAMLLAAASAVRTLLNAEGWQYRVGAACEGVMAGGMAAMLLVP